jgi:ketosteroid isomerase-like protein
MDRNTSNRDRVQAIYEAFGRGDVPSILEAVSDDVDWEYAGATDQVPWLVHRRGRAGVGKFFEALGALDIKRFVPHTLLAAQDTVVALIELEATVKTTGKAIDNPEEIHVWHFDRAGKVVRFRHALDTAQHVAACRT